VFVTWFFLLCLLPPPTGHTQEQPELLNPFAGDPEAVKEGRKLWLFLGCSGCHGVMGGGGMGARVLDDTWRFGSDDPTLYKLIKGQIPEQTMVAYAALPDEQVWKALSYVRSLYKGDPALIDWAPAPPPDAAAGIAAPPPPVPAFTATPPKGLPDMKTPVPSHTPIPKVGKATYDAQCSLCHGTAGAGDGPLAQKLMDEPSNWTAGGGGLKGMGDQQIFDVIAKGGIAIGKSTAMPANPNLSEAEVGNLVAYVKSLEGTLEAELPQDASASEPRPLGGEPLRWGSALDWAMVLTIGLSGLILICIFLSLVIHRGRQTEGSALWLHLLSLGICPLLLLAVGNFSVLEYAKEERFCGTCHLTMKPYIDDLYDGKSRSLAALHFQHRFARGTECYSCHANYGVHGTFEAKMMGLQDVYKYVTRTYHLPVKMRAPYENMLCLKCHSEAKRFVAAFGGVHLKLSDQLRTGLIKCAGCHKPAHDIPKLEQSARLGEAN
jgi:mono/diheme cytochrome c family protein/nitrate/TMAO reductase-like tetraheme cytochrome c subunit